MNSNTAQLKKRIELLMPHADFVQVLMRNDKWKIKSIIEAALFEYKEELEKYLNSSDPKFIAEWKQGTPLSYTYLLSNLKKVHIFIKVKIQTT